MIFSRTLLVLLLSALVFAPITAYIAYSHGRSFWRWYALGMVLPFASVFVAMFVAMRQQLTDEKGGRGPTPPRPQ